VRNRHLGFRSNVKSTGRTGYRQKAPSRRGDNEGRRIGAKSERERDYIEAVAAYYKDFATRPEKDRQVSRAKAYEALAQRYPADDEAKIFFALYNAGTQTQADQSYAAYLKSAGILETQFKKYPDHQVLRIT
jgi:hypothetical protein